MEKYSGQEVTLDDEEYVILAPTTSLRLSNNNCKDRTYLRRFHMAAKNIKFKEEARQKI